MGGLGRIGMNAMLVGAGDRWVMVDCGVQWPDSDVIGADRQLPDLGFLESWKGKIEASATRKPETPRTLSCGSQTTIGSERSPMRQEEE